MTTKNQEFGDVLRDLRKKYGISLGKLAERIGITATYLSDVELGRRHPFRHDLIEQIATILGLTDDEVHKLVSAASVERGTFELSAERRVRTEARVLSLTLTIEGRVRRQRLFWESSSARRVSLEWIEESWRPRMPHLPSFYAEQLARDDATTLGAVTIAIEEMEVES